MPSPRPLRALRIASASLLVALLTLSCSDHSPTGVQPQPQAGALTPRQLLGLPILGGVVEALLPCNVTTTSTATQTIGPYGGVLIVGPHSLIVPPGALAAPVTITGTAPAGKYVEIDFQPQGLRFAKKATLTMSYQSCALPLSLLYNIVYTDDSYNILEILPSLSSLLSPRVSAPIGHFSHYMVAE